MKKILRRGIKPLLILFCTLMFVSTIASANTIVQIVPTTQTVDQGDTFTVDVQVIPDRPLRGVQVDITYSSSLLTGDASNGGMFLNFIPPNVNPGELSQMSGYQMPAQASVATTGNLAEIEFTASAINSGQTDLLLLNVKVKDENGVALPANEVNVIGGSVTVQENGGVTKTTVYIVPDIKTVYQGDTFTVDIRVIPHEPIRGVQVDLTYSSSLLSGTTASDGGMFLNFIPPNVNPGEFSQISGYQMPAEAAVVTTGDLAEIEFIASATETGQTYLNLLNVKVKDENGDELPASDVEVIVGSVIVEEPSSCLCDFCFDLQQGWNMVSIPHPIDPSESNYATDVFELELGDGCWRYDTPTEKYYDGDPSDPLLVVSCEGYFVYKATSKAGT